MKRVKGEQGFVKGLLILLVIAAVGYAGIAFGMPYYRYNTLISHMKTYYEFEGGRVTVEAIKEKVMEEAEKLNIPINEENVKVTMNEAKFIKIEATWSEIVDFWGYYQHKLDFEVKLDL